MSLERNRAPRREEKKPPRADGRYQRKYKGKYFYADTDEEAKRLRDEYKYQCEHGVDQLRNITVSDYAADWLPNAKASVSDKCYNDYAVQMDVLTSVCGDKYMNAVRPDDIKKVWRHYLGYSDSTIRRARMLYRSFFAAGIENGYCRSNPVNGESAQPHKGTSGTHRPLEPWERRVIESVPHRMRAPAMLMLYAGLRRGEMLAFSGKDVVNDQICVRQAVRFDGNLPVLCDPKTEAGKRNIPLMEILRPYVKDLDGYILKDRSGKLCSETAFKNAWADWKRKIECSLNGCSQKRWYFIRADYRARDPKRYDQIQRLLSQGKKEEADALRLMDWKEWTVRPHDLRHSFCVMLRDAGVDLKLAIRWMGHADEKMILRIYDHITDLRIQTAVDSVNTLTGFAPEPKKNIHRKKENPRLKAV